ncbi:MAG: sn-glycerol-3-phosphate ABC transporter ATP-binding protein UgpC [Bacillus sp. (in: firmicutes)]
MASLNFKQVKKSYDNGTYSVKDFNLEIFDKEFFVFLGPSGCGKSTTLRMIAGLEQITEGDLFIDGTRVNELEPKNRDIAMVFQNYALYPHMTVYENMAYPLKIKKISKRDIEERVNSAAKILGLESLLKRKTNALSGGQRQRVAIGRAIVRDPKVFLLDEPLSNLDAKLRVQMREELIKLHKRLQTTFIYVTHDQTEAMTMADRIVVMKDGRIQQVATPFDIYNYPINKFVASFIGSPSMNFLEGTLTEMSGKVYFEYKQNYLNIENNKAEKLKKQGYLNQKIILGIRPEDIAITDLGGNCLSGEIELIENMGSASYIEVSVANKKLLIKATGFKTSKISNAIKLALNKEKMHFFDGHTEMAIR